MDKVCTKCGVSKDLSEFYNLKRSRDGKQWWCKECCALYNKEHQVNAYEFIDMSVIKYKHDKWHKENKERLKKERDLKKT